MTIHESSAVKWPARLDLLHNPGTARLNGVARWAQPGVMVPVDLLKRMRGLHMRLPLIPPNQLTPEQKALYDAMRKGIASNFNAFKVERDDGALMGPWNPWLHEPAIV
jgi:hypothetical protein